MSYGSGLVLEKECSVCGKAVIVTHPAAYLYKRLMDGVTKYQCSYRCYRKVGGDSGCYQQKQKRHFNKHV